MSNGEADLVRISPELRGSWCIELAVCVAILAKGQVNEEQTRVSSCNFDGQHA